MRSIVLEKQNHLLFSSSLEERKQVVQEFVDSVYVSSIFSQLSSNPTS